MGVILHLSIPLFLDIINVYANNINLEDGAGIKVDILLFMDMFISVWRYTWLD